MQPISPPFPHRLPSQTTAIHLDLVRRRERERFKFLLEIVIRERDKSLCSGPGITKSPNPNLELVIKIFQTLKDPILTFPYPNPTLKAQGL